MRGGAQVDVRGTFLIQHSGRPAIAPLTKFESRGPRLGRSVRDIIFRKNLRAFAFIKDRRFGAGAFVRAKSRISAVLLPRLDLLQAQWWFRDRSNPVFRTDTNHPSEKHGFGEKPKPERP